MKVLCGFVKPTKGHLGVRHFSWPGTSEKGRGYYKERKKNKSGIMYLLYLVNNNLNKIIDHTGQYNPGINQQLVAQNDFTAELEQ